MTVWILTRGEYSDRSIQGVFSSREKIDAYIRESGIEYNDPEEWPVDEMIEWRKGSTWVARINATGQVHAYENRGVFRHPEITGITASPNNAGRLWGCVITSPISAEHAMKVAIEKRQEWLRGWDGITIREHPPVI